MWVVVSGASSLNHSDGKTQGGFTVAVANEEFAEGKARWPRSTCYGGHRSGFAGVCYRRRWAARPWPWATDAPSANGSVPLGTRCWTDHDPGSQPIRARCHGSNGATSRASSREAPTEWVVGAKGLYDNLHRDAAAAGSHERRMLVDIKVMAHSVRCLRGQVRWIPGEIMLSDCLTKRADQATLMRWVMPHRKYGVTEEAVMSILKELSTTMAKYDKVSAKWANTSE